MKQQENMILNQLNQYKNLYLQASNENAHLKHAVSKHEDELETNRKTIESMDSRILELEENQKEWDKEKAQLQSQRDCYKKERKLEKRLGAQAWGGRSREQEDEERMEKKFSHDCWRCLFSGIFFAITKVTIYDEN